jgi:2-keto-4-pentenoate hydratase/2-oxohepta-3-ene-1,7-dioic acid hydratase in catechol pathway
VKLCLFQTSAKGKIEPGLITDRGVVSIASAVRRVAGRTPQETMVGIIDNYAKLKPALAKAAKSGKAVPLAKVRLKAPLPRPGKILACIGNYWEHQEREPREPNMFLKNPDCVIGPGDTITLPRFTEPVVFHHEAELAIVFKGPAKTVSQKNWRRAVFGYTGMIDVSARGEGRFTWKRGSWMGKSFDTFGPMGPCITTADEIKDPNKLHIRFWNDGQLRHDYNTDDMENRVPKLVEWASTIMTLNSGDLLMCGTNHEGLGPLQDGEKVTFELEKIGTMSLKVRDPLKRKWERGVYMGPNSTNPEAVRRERETARREAAEKSVIERAKLEGRAGG